MEDDSKWRACSVINGKVANVKIAEKAVMNSMTGIYARANVSVAARRKPNSITGMGANVLAVVKFVMSSTLGMVVYALNAEDSDMNSTNGMDVSVLFVAAYEKNSIFG